MASRNSRRSRNKRNVSALLDPEAQIRAEQSTTEVELLNLSTDGRRRIRTQADIVPTAARPLHTRLFDFSFDEGDPNFPIQADTHFDAHTFDAADTFIVPTPEMSDVVIKESRRTQRWINSVCIFHHVPLRYSTLTYILRMRPSSPGCVFVNNTSMNSCAGKAVDMELVGIHVRGAESSGSFFGAEIVRELRCTVPGAQ